MVLLCDTCHIEIPFHSHRRGYFCPQVPARNWNESLSVCRVAGGQGAELSPLPRLPLLLAMVWGSAGTPRLCTVCSGRWGIPLTSNYQFLYTWEDIFWHSLSSSLRVWLTAPWLIYFLTSFLHLLRCQP